MKLYRIAKRERSSDLSGIGAAMYPGRWNKFGTPILYTGTTEAIALLEVLVHLPPMLSPQLDLLTIQIPDESITKLEVNQLPSNWRQYPAPAILAEIAQEWVTKGQFLALQVPSCVVPNSFNVLLNCAFPDYTKKVIIIDHQPFDFDDRLMK